MNVRKLPSPAGTVRLAWDPVPGCDGYRFYSAGVLRSKTMDPTRSTVKFSAGQEPYEVEAVVLSGIDRGKYPPNVQPPEPTYVEVAPRVAYEEGGSDARFCTVGQPGVVPEPGAPVGHTIDGRGATYDDNGLCKNGLRSGGPAVTGARSIDGRAYCSLPTMGDPKKQTGSWSI